MSHNMRLLLAILFLLTSTDVVAQPLPTKAQLEWHKDGFYLFVHFGPNTFTNKEWGEGTEPGDIFNPAQLDCRQWCRIAKQAGAKGIIITAKHHDGFCLWPSQYSSHTVRESSWKNGKGDVLKELSAACRDYGLKFGVYLSPWDRNHPKYGTDEYNDVFVNMMTEIFRNYGPIWELWWDGANGEGPNGKKQVYDWKRFENTVRKLSPQTVVFSDIGPDVRWVGNERGIAAETNWNRLDTAGFTRGLGAPPTDTLMQGNFNGKNWIPAECDVSIRPGWFYHSEEDDKVKKPEQLFDLYLKSVGRGANLLLNVPPDRRGLIHEKDSAALIGFQNLRATNFSNNLAKKASPFFSSNEKESTSKFIADERGDTYQLFHHASSFAGIRFKQPETINCIVLSEYLQNGQHCSSFELILQTAGGSEKRIRGTTIGNKRIFTFPTVSVSGIKLFIRDQKKPTAVSEIEVYRIAEALLPR